MAEQLPDGLLSEVEAAEFLLEKISPGVELSPLPFAGSLTQASAPFFISVHCGTSLLLLLLDEIRVPFS